MAQCESHLDMLFAFGRVLCDIGISEETKCLRRLNANQTVTDDLADKRSEMIGDAFPLEARKMEEAIQLESLHPATQILMGEQSGWRTEIRPVHHIQLPGGVVK